MSSVPESDEESRFVVGIDLGTTNSAVTYIDTDEEPWRVRTFGIPQLVAPSEIETRETLPSFHYERAPGEFGKDALRLPWDNRDADVAVGVFARDHGMAVPSRLIGSAKSWLCHTGVDRTANLLPWQGGDDVERLSPVAASSRYLAHIRDAWNHEHADEPLAAQDIVLTLPASFDEVARELTVQAARAADLPRVVLIEEPQAAFYAWIDHHKHEWDTLVSPGQTILVCDIGGGTSDFTLIRVRRGDDGKVQFHRVAVGEHLILGGDNLDLALAHHVEQQVTAGRRLEPRQWSVLVRTCRKVKETLLGPNPPENYTVTLPGTGSRLIGGSLQATVTREDAQALLLDGFLPRVALDDAPRNRQSGFQEFGLPYAPDAAITRYLAQFLTSHRDVIARDQDIAAAAEGSSAMVKTADERLAHDPARPDIVLFNGGLFESTQMRDRLLEVLGAWFRDDSGDWQPQVLRNDRLDLAVAHGAAYYGMVRRGKAVRIAAGLARTYYIGIDAKQGEPNALCLLPAGIEPGHNVELTEHTFELTVSEPVEFPLHVSSTRMTDQPGDIVPVDAEQMKSLPPIRTVLKTRKKADAGVVPVHIHAGLTEIGTVDMWCSEVDGGRRWRLQFDVRSATQTDIEAHRGTGEQQGVIEDDAWQQCRSLIQATFASTSTASTSEKAAVDAAPERLAKQLSRVLETNRNQWPGSLLRSMWQELIDHEPGRRRTQTHEARWLNLLGFALRPGFGIAMDDWRVAETWKVLQNKLVHGTPACRAEWMIFWRRIGGGLDAGQQVSLATPFLSPIRQTHRQITTGKGKGSGLNSLISHEAAEVWRLLGSLELLPVRTKVELGNIISDLLPRKKLEPVRDALTWALGRVASRVPLYGPLNSVVGANTAGTWLKTLLSQPDSDGITQLAVMQIARRTDDRYRDVSDADRQWALDWFDSAGGASTHYRDLVAVGGDLDQADQGQIFGEALPAGLRLSRGL
ncbi:MAG: Hsp70 family protein [Planctomycetota bacterium]|nr:Hsp70 family protein [Planctomycetota bacterium]